MNDVLAGIVEATRADLAGEVVDWRSLHRAARLRSQQKQKHSFQRALRPGGNGRIRLIAEIKAASPSAGPIVENPDVESIARTYAEGGAAAISVVTEPHFFRGDRAWIYRASEASGLPVIMKDFIIDPVQIYRGIAAGADAALLLASVLDTGRLREFLSILDELGRDAIVEVHDAAELSKAIDAGAGIIGVNNRNLRDFSVDLSTSEELAKEIPDSILRVAESGIRSREDVDRLRAAGFHAVLVGESLLRSPDRGATVRALVGEER